MSRFLGIFLALFLIAAGVGCSTHAHRLADIREAYYRGDLQQAESHIESAGKWKSKEADVLKLDRAMVLLLEGKTKEAEKLLREVRDNFDYLEQKDIGEFALSMVTDDQQLSYAGEDYEKVLVRAFLALSNLMHGGQDATAYALQVADKQQQIIQNGQSEDGRNPKESYKQVAVGAYINAAIRETHMQYDEASRSLQQVCHWAPEFTSGRRELERVQKGRHSARGNGVVYVFTLVGRGPYKEESLEIPSQIALLVADRIISHNAEHTLPPTIAPIKVPKVVVPHNYVQGVQVLVNGQPQGKTETLTDIGRMAKEQNEALLPYVVGRAIARRITKKALIYGAKEVIDPDRYDLTDIALMIGGVIWEATESADTRCWGLLPDKIQVLRLELPAGTHELALQPVDHAGVPMGEIRTTPVRVDDGRNTYLLASFPTQYMVGNIITSNQ